MRIAASESKMRMVTSSELKLAVGASAMPFQAHTVTTRRRVLVYAFLACCAGWSRADQILRDGFSSVQRYERVGPESWHIGGGACRFDNGGREACLIANVADLEDGRIEAVISIEKRQGNQYPYAGVILYGDTSNSWKLLLVENPKRTRYLELLERCRGVHQAQTQAAQSGMRLSAKREGNLKSWEYGRRYKLTLALSVPAIVARVTDLATDDWWQQTYYFASGRAVRRGRPGLCVAGMKGRFEELHVAGRLPPGMPGLSVTRGAAGAAAILRDESGASAARLKTAFADAGFGVTELSWGDLERGQVPVEEVDLLVLADARRLPVTAKTSILSFLRRGGKVMAIAAPAFGTMLAKSPKGWVGESEYDSATADSLTAAPIPFAIGEWSRSAKDATRPGKIEGAQDGWRVTVDFGGWDGFGRDVERPFPDGHGATVFWAKGDARTPELAVEWRESDGSRWIGTVPLSTHWRGYVMEPRDFAHWPESKAKRGRAGDCFNPTNAARIIFWLCTSHTRKCEPGPHTYWVRGLSWAREPERERPDFQPPEIETLSPSYKIHPIASSVALVAGAEQTILPNDWRVAWRGRGYSSLWRERGRGYDRARAWRWVPVAEAVDRDGRRRGADVSLLIGDRVLPDAVVGAVGVADPAALAEPELMRVAMALAKSMVRGCFLTEAGSRFFSYRDGEAIEFGAEAANRGRTRQALRVKLAVADKAGGSVLERAEDLHLDARTRGRARWQWVPRSLPTTGYTVTAELYEGGTLLDRISHPIDRLRSKPAEPDEFVSVRGSHFYLRGRKWFMRGINYRPNFIGGYGTLDVFQRVSYDPEIIERDLTTLESMGINFLSAIHALAPPQPDRSSSYRDLHDLLNRCSDHNIKIFYFLPHGRPYRGADVEKIKQHITVAGIKDHPAIMAWELAWEPHENPWQGKMDFIVPDWNRWVAQRYGSVENALRDWTYAPEVADDTPLPVPTAAMCRAHGEWDRMVAAFRRFFSDVMSQKYGHTARELRKFDPKHLISFRGGGCGIPYRERFAHIHSVGVAKHLDFLNPEGYSLMTHGWGKPTPGDDIRKGGLITLYYRFISREKPVTWMEFGYTIRGMRRAWTQDMLHNSPIELARQRQEYEHFYKMFLESGARGAAPWWLPGGYRLGERSDFGVLDADGVERPVCEIIRRYVPQFANVEHKPPTAHIDVDLDAHYPDSWSLYSDQYLKLIQAGEIPCVRTDGTGTDSANTPLVAVGNVPCNGHNPPKYLNAEFNSLEVFDGRVWREAKDADTVKAERGARILCRASVGNIAEAKWLAPRAGLTKGGVYLAGRREFGHEFRARIRADTDFLRDADVPTFTLVPSLATQVTVSFEMLADGRTWFGERRTVVIAPATSGDTR